MGVAPEFSTHFDANALILAQAQLYSASKGKSPYLKGILRTAAIVTGLAVSLGESSVIDPTYTKAYFRLGKSAKLGARMIEPLYWGFMTKRRS